MEFTINALFLVLNADLIARFHRVWRLRLRRAERAWALGLPTSSYDLGLETQLENLLAAHPAVVHAASSSFDWEGERAAAERACLKRGEYSDLTLEVYPELGEVLR